MHVRTYVIRDEKDKKTKNCGRSSGVHPGRRSFGLWIRTVLTQEERPVPVNTNSQPTTNTEELLNCRKNVNCGYHVWCLVVAISKNVIQPKSFLVLRFNGYDRHIPVF